MTVREDVALAAELGRRLDALSGPRPVGVTDLLAVRQAYWRATAPPAPISAARGARLAHGRRVHRVLADLFATEGQLEVRVRRQGVVGRIDVLTDRPLELKSTSVAIGPDELLSERPEYAEQLAMYCALAGRRAGRIVTVILGDEDRVEVRTLDLGFLGLPALSQNMERRAAVLRVALEGERPDELPRCRWFERGCEFRAGGMCDCTGSEPEEVPLFRDAPVEIIARPDLDRELTPRLSGALRSRKPPEIERFRDLVYPRRTYFDRSHGQPPAEKAPSAKSTSASPTYLRLTGVVEAGPLGEVTRLPSLADEPAEDVAAFQGLPYLARTSRAVSALRAERLVRDHPQYALDLGFRCATVGATSARVLVAYERPSEPADWVQVFELTFDPLTRFARLWRTRASALSRALAESSPSHLPPCPEWMYPDCPYRAECGCGATPGRSQR